MAAGGVCRGSILCGVGLSIRLTNPVENTTPNIGWG